MSNNIKVQMHKTGPNAKLDYILNSYNSLKLILMPNLNEKNIIFMNSIIDIIISQLEVFIELLYINETKKIYELLNMNNQNLSKQIAGIYEDIKLNKYSVNSSTDKDKIDSQIYFNKKESDLLEQQKESFSIINSSNHNKYADSDGNNTRKKDINKKPQIKVKDKDKNKNINKLKEKEKLIQNLKELEKERSREIREKARILLKKKNSKNQFTNCSKLTKNSQQSEIKSIISNNSSSKTEIASKNLYNNRNETEGKITEINDYKYRYVSPFKLTNKSNYNSKVNLKENEKKFKRSKTQLYESLLGIDSNMLPMNVSISFTNRLLDRIKRPNKKKNNKSIQTTLEDNNNLQKYRNYQNNNYTPKTEIGKTNKIFNLKNDDYFSLDKFLTPFNKGGEQMFLTKEGKLINKKEKDILEDYINNHLFENDKNKTERKCQSKSNYNIYNIIPITNNSKEKMTSIKEQKNKIFSSKKPPIKYDLNVLYQLFKKFSFSFQVPIDDLFLKNKKSSLLDKSIFKVCQNILDNYQELENKEDIFTYRAKSNSRSKIRSRSYNNNLDNSHNFFN